MKKFLAVLLTLTLFVCLPFGAMAAGEEKILANGIDVSYANYGTNKTVDFQKVKAAGYSFVIIRAGYSGRGTSETQPITQPDTHFELNYKNALAAGLRIGVYYYSYARTVAEADRDAADCLRFLQDKKISYPVYYDMEDEKYQGNLTTQQRTNIALAFTRKVQQAGYMAGVYANKDWFTNKLNLSAIAKECEIWWAQYPNSDKPDLDMSAYGLWQYASDGKVDGVTENGNLTNVDVNVAYKDYVSLVRNHTFINAENKMDMDGNKTVDLKDAVLCAQYIAGWDNLTVSNKVLNYNGSCKIPTLKDVAAIMRTALNE